jgi:hypothetical protein
MYGAVRPPDLVVFSMLRTHSMAYEGRHTGGAQEVPGSRRTVTTGHWLSRFVRRPLVSAAAILAAAGVSAAASSEAKPYTPVVSFTASPLAVAQAAELSHNQDDTNAALAAARRSGVQRASALTHHQQAAVDAAGQSRMEAALDLVTARLAAAERVARAEARQGLLDRAQSDPKAVGHLLAADRGWDGEQYSCLDSLWSKESGWRWNADNASSDAYGIPQALPGSRMASFGSDWASNPVTQIKWGLQYISARYGTPCSAWAHSRAVNWY